MIMSEQLHNARRCAGRKREVADHDFSDIDGVKRVHILGGVDGKQYFFFIEMLRQRQLHKNAVHRRIGVQLGNQREQFIFACIRREGIHIRADADLLARAVLVAHIDLGCGVISDQHDTEPGNLPGFVCKSDDGVANLASNRLRCFFSVK